MVFGSELTARVTASVRDFTSGFERMEDSLNEVRNASVQTSGSFSALSATSTLATSSTLTLSNALILSLAPALGVVAAAAVPVVTALGGFVAVAGAIAGIGFAGVIGAIATNTQTLKQQFGILVSVIKTEFAPLFDLAADVIITLLTELTSLIPELVPARAELEQLADAFLDIGLAIIDILPNLAELAVTVATDFLPPFARFAQDILPQVPGFLRDLISVFRRLLPSFREAGRILSRLSPELLDFGFVALNVVGPALADIARVLVTALNRFNDLSNNIQTLGVQIAAVAPILLGLVSILGGPITLAIAGLIGLVVGLQQAWENNLFGIVAVVNQFVNQAEPLLNDFRSAAEAFLSGVGFERLADDAAELEGVLSEQLFQVIRDAKPLFNDLEQLLQDNRSEFRTIGRAVGNFLEGVIDLATFLASGIGPLFNNVILPVLRGFVTLLDGAIKNTANLIELFGALEAGNLSQAQQEIEDIGRVRAQTATELIGRGNIQAAQENIGGLIEVVVEEDTENLNATIRNQSENVILEENRRSDRLRERGFQP